MPKSRLLAAGVLATLLLSSCGGPADESGGVPPSDAPATRTAREVADEIAAIVAVSFEEMEDVAADLGLEDADPADLEALRESCAAGDMAACDDLFWASPADSEDEQFGASCGGTRDPSAAGSCETSAGTGSADLEALRESCATGDMAACDNLYWSSEVGSDDEQFGASCGGTRDPSAAGSCETPVEFAPADVGPLRESCAAGDMAACDDLYMAADVGSDDEQFGSTCGGTESPTGGYCEALVAGVYDDALLSEVSPLIEALTVFAEKLGEAATKVRDLDTGDVTVTFTDPDFPLWVEVSDTDTTFCVTPSDEDDGTVDVVEGPCDPSSEDLDALEPIRLALRGELDIAALLELAQG